MGKIQKPINKNNLSSQQVDLSQATHLGPKIKSYSITFLMKYFVSFKKSFSGETRKNDEEKKRQLFCQMVFTRIFISRILLLKKRKNFSILKAQKKTLPLMTQLWSTTGLLNGYRVATLTLGPPKHDF